MHKYGLFRFEILMRSIGQTIVMSSMQVHGSSSIRFVQITFVFIANRVVEIFSLLSSSSSNQTLDFEHHVASVVQFSATYDDSLYCHTFIDN